MYRGQVVGGIHFLPFILLCLAAHLTDPSWRPPVPPATSLTGAPLSLTAVFLSHSGSARAPLLATYINRSLVPIGFRYYFINWTQTNQTDPPNLAPPHRYRRLIEVGLAGGRRWVGGRRWMGGRKSPDLFANFFFAVNFFLESTTDRWLYRATDDALVNFRGLRGYIEELDGAHDPLREFVALGNCLVVPEVRFPYLQGGAGYLLSRSACAGLAPMAEKIVAHGFYTEDAAFGGVLRDLNVTDITSDRFLGYSILKGQKRALFKNWNFLPGCPPAPVNKAGCTPLISTVRRVIFFHQHAPFNKYYWSLARRLFGAPQNVMWYMAGVQPMLCKTRPPIFGARL
jgi:hypothetical protein